MFQIGCDFLVCLDVCRERIRCKRRTEARTSLVEPKNLWFKKKTWNFVVPDLESSIYLIALLINLFMNQLIFFQFFALEKKDKPPQHIQNFSVMQLPDPGPLRNHVYQHTYFSDKRGHVCALKIQHCLFDLNLQLAIVNSIHALIGSFSCSSLVFALLIGIVCLAKTVIFSPDGSE